MKYIFFYIFFIITIILYAQTYNTKYTIIVKSKTLKNCYVQKGDSILLFETKRMNSICLNIDEPQRLIIRNTSTKNYIYFFIERGIHTIYIDLDKYTLFSKTSKLCNENYEVLKIKKHYDTLMENSYLKNDGLPTNQPTKLDTVKYEYNKAYYNWCIKHPKSFISLAFCESQAQHWKETPLKKEEINALYNVLDSSLRKYATYAKCKIFMDNYVNNTKISQENDSLKNTIKPLWNSK